MEIIPSPPGPVRPLRDPMLEAEERMVFEWLKKNPPSKWVRVNRPPEPPSAPKHKPIYYC